MRVVVDTSSFDLRTKLLKQLTRAVHRIVVLDSKRAFSRSLASSCRRICSSLWDLLSCGRTKICLYNRRLSNRPDIIGRLLGERFMPGVGSKAGEKGEFYASVLYASWKLPGDTALVFLYRQNYMVLGRNLQEVYSSIYPFANQEKAAKSTRCPSGKGGFKCSFFQAASTWPFDKFSPDFYEVPGQLCMTSWWERRPGSGPMEGRVQPRNIFFLFQKVGKIFF